MPRFSNFAYGELLGGLRRLGLLRGARQGVRRKSLRLERLEPRFVLDSAPLEIGEFMAINQTTLADADGDYSDWIEVHNTTTAAVSLEGWHLTDDAAELEKWHFPAVTLEAGGRLVVFASGKDRRMPGSELHTNFQLDGNGEYLALVEPDGHTAATEFAPTFPPQRTDVSYGVGEQVLGGPLVVSGAAAETLVPHNGSLDLNWTGSPAQEPFNDTPAAGWNAAVTGVGYDLDAATGPRPAAYWSFDNNVNDASGNGHSGVLYGAVYSSDVPPGIRTGKSLSFDGVNDYVSAVLNVSETHYTASLWFKADTAGHGLFAVVDPDLGANGNDRLLYLSGTDLAANVWNDETISTNGKNYVDGQWHNLIHVYGSEINGQRIYVDGQRVASGTKAASDFTAQTRINIGFANDAAGRYFDGLIDDVAVWDSVLTEDQIRALAAGASPLALTGYTRSIGADVATAMRNVNPSAYVRIPFTVTTPGDVQSLRLRLRYDDGFVAWLNGQEIARRNAPATIAFNSTATVDRAKAAAVQFEDIDLPAAAALLRGGTNILAIQGLNDQTGSSDFLVLPELVNVGRLADRYMTLPTPGRSNDSGILGYVADTKFSVDRGFYDASFQLTITTATPGATIRYTTNGSLPTATNGTTYTGPLTINRTTTLRAYAYKTDYRPANVDTQTYIFVDDVVRQDYQATINAGFPATWGSVTPDYGMDPDVIGQTGADLFGGVYAAEIRSDLKAIPTLSIVMNTADMFGANGIYSNSTARGDTWERAASAELIYADKKTGFQIDAGIQVQGGAFRSDGLTKKHSLRLVFKEEFGPTKLDFPLFGAGASDHFDTIMLRANSNDGWQWGDAGGQPQYARDEFARRSRLAMGVPDAHGTYVHVYINGIYWGMYDATERPDRSFGADYFGGDKEDWDILNTNGVVSGSATAWNTLLSMCNDVAGASTETARTAAYYKLLGCNPDGTRNPAWEVYLNVDNYIDYMIVNLYGGNTDWPHKNYYFGRLRGPESTGFEFFDWDAEWSLNLRCDVNTNQTGVSAGVAQPYAKLRSSLEFRLRFADHLRKHFSAGGVFYVDPAHTAWDPAHPERNVPAARYAQIASEIRSALVGESARWGDQHRNPPYTRNLEWQAELNNLLNNYFPLRSANVMQQFRSAGIYPGVETPAFSQQGGVVPSGYVLAMSGAGSVYYTLDGSDPRLPGGAVSPAALAYSSVNPPRISDLKLVRARALSGGVWSPLNEAQFYINQPAAAANCVASEINYNPYPPTATELQTNPAWTADDFEFLELRNTTNQPVDFSNVQFAAGITFSFPADGAMLLPAGESAVLVKDPAAFQARYGAGIRIAGQYAGKLDNAGEQLRLADHAGQAIFDFTYSDGGDWPGRADGKGSTAELIDPAAVPAAEAQRTTYLQDGAHWQASKLFLGTPGAGSTAPLVDVVINEVLAHSDQPLVDAVELYNTTSNPVDIGGWWLSDTDADYQKFRIPDGTVLAAQSFLVFYEGHYVAGQLEFAANEFGGGAKGFGLNGAHGDDVFLLQTNAAGDLVRFADHVDFGPTASGESLGRWPDDQGNARLAPMLGRTLEAPGNVNSTGGNGPRTGPLVISEVMYAPKALIGSEQSAGFADQEGMEFIEIFNPTDSAVTLTNWHLDKAVTFDFPAGTSLAAGKTLVVVAFDPANAMMLSSFRTRYGMGVSQAVVGPYAGHLANAGDKLQLQRPDAPPPDEPAYYPPLLEDEIIYSSAWGGGAADGKSLQRVAVDAWGLNQASWAAATASPGTAHVVAGRSVFYNNSAFDGRSATANAADDQAIAADKQPLLPGRRATFNNYTSYSRGINGIMLDLAGAGGTFTAADFEFRAGSDEDPAVWPLVEVASAFSVRPAAGIAGTTRVMITWPDNAIQNQWLRVKVLNTAHTGLAGPDVFYFGSVLGETGNRSAGPDSDATVDEQDAGLARTNKTQAVPASLTSPYDFNRDRRIDATDEIIARANYRVGADALPLLDLTDPAQSAALAVKETAAETRHPVLSSECRVQSCPPRATGVPVVPSAPSPISVAAAVLPPAHFRTSPAQPTAPSPGNWPAAWQWFGQLQQANARQPGKKLFLLEEAKDWILATSWPR